MTDNAPIDFLATRQPTQSTYVILSYLHEFFHNPDWEEDIAFKAQLLKCKLDYSLTSLRKIDRLLDTIRNQKSPEIEDFISKDCNQNFLFLLAYYCGEVKGRARGQAPIWQDYDEFMRTQPSTQITWLGSFNPPEIPEGEFKELFVCRFSDEGESGEYNFFPLVNICKRLFGEDKQSSVYFSANINGGKYISESKPLPEAPPHYLEFSGADLVAKTPASHLPYLQMLPPNWMWGDPLMEQMQQLGNLYQNGRVVWASLVQANNLLLGNDREESCPAEVVYDATGRTPPHILKGIARDLFSLKGGRKEKSEYNFSFKQLTGQLNDDELARYGEHISNEKSRLFTRLKLNHIVIETATAFIWRPHLPNGIISIATFPILIADDTKVVTPLPARYWSHTAYYRQWFAEQDVTNQHLLATEPKKEAEKMCDKDSKNRETTPAFLSLLNSGEAIWQGYEELLFPQVEELPALSSDVVEVETPDIGQWFIRRCVVNIKTDYRRFYEGFLDTPNTEQQVRECMKQLQAGEDGSFDEDIRALAKLRLFDYCEYLSELDNPEYNQKIGVSPLKKVATLLTQSSITALQAAELVRFLRNDSNKGMHEIMVNEGKPEADNAPQPNTTASLYLAYLYASGKFVPQSIEEAMAWLNYAAGLGDWRAMHWLAEFQYAIPEMSKAILSVRLSNESSNFFINFMNLNSYMNKLNITMDMVEIDKQKQLFLNHHPAMLEMSRQLFTLAEEEGHPKAKSRLQQLIQSGEIPSKPSEERLQSLEHWLTVHFNGLIEKKERVPALKIPWITLIFIAVFCMVCFYFTGAMVLFLLVIVKVLHTLGPYIPSNQKKSQRLGD